MLAPPACLPLEAASEPSQNWAQGPMQPNQGVTAGDLPAPSLPNTLASVTVQRGRLSLRWPPRTCCPLGVPSARVSPRGNKPRGTVSWLPLSPCRELWAPSEQWLLCSLVYSRRAGRRAGAPAAGLAAAPSARPDRRPLAQGCEAEPRPAQARRGATLSLPPWIHQRHCLQRDHGTWIPLVTAV